jgi:hypothetical protein
LIKKELLKDIRINLQIKYYRIKYYLNSRGALMADEYLKNDMERVKKKFADLMHDGEIEAIELKIEKLNNKSSPDPIDEIWLEIYNDVLDLKKNKDLKEKE